MKKRRVRIKKTVIPGIFTLMNMFFGFLAIVMVAQDGFRIAAWLILAAALFDMLDGKLARLIKSPSKFGVEFDSIADLVSFCTTPAVIIYFAYVRDLHPVLAASISFVPLIFGGIRLARFNILTDENPLPFFIGLPTTAMAVVLASFMLFNLTLFDNPGNPKVALPLIFILSFLMVSPIRYKKVPDFKKKLGGKLMISFLLLSGISIAIFGSVALFPIAMLYVVWGIINRIVHTEIYEIELNVEPVSTVHIHRNGG